MLNLPPTLLVVILKSSILVSLICAILIEAPSLQCTASYPDISTYPYYSCYAVCGSSDRYSFTSSSYASINGTTSYECQSTVYAGCWNPGYYAAMIFVLVEISIHAVMFIYYGESACKQKEMIEIINKSEVLKVESLTTLLHPFLCSLAILEGGWFGILFYTYDYGNYVSCDDSYVFSTGSLQLSLIITSSILLLYYPVFVNGVYVSLDKNASFKDKILSFLRLDLLLIYSFLRGMQIFVLPVSVLSYISLLKLERSKRFHSTSNSKSTSDTLNMDIRKSSIFYDLRPTNSFLNEKSESSLEDRNSQGRQLESSSGLILTIVRKLSTRWTVNYSFIKLLASIMLSLVLNNDYRFCGLRGYMNYEDCPVDCEMSCMIATGPYMTHTHSCSENNITYESCGCANWLLTDFLVICLNILHFTLQCFYLVQYDQFDPQQNQIDCVQSYTFVGDNITLFLTHPAITLLSVIESAILAISWTSVILGIGLKCPHDDNTSSIQFALFMTFIEVYKANMTVANKSLAKKKYGKMILSLFRVDLFIFYGGTLFFQTFLFPFSIAGYFYNVCFAGDDGDYSNIESALLDKGDDATGDEISEHLLESDQYEPILKTGAINGSP